jgi:hypothetical protein
LNSELSQLIALQEIDLEIKRLNQELIALPERQQEIERQFAESVKEFLELKKQLDDAQTEKSRLESQLNDEQTKQNKFREDLMKATNQREYETAVREIDVAKKTISLLETDILKLMDKVEKLEAGSNERSPEIEARRAEVDRQIAQTALSVAGHKERLQALKTEREQKLTTLSPNSRATYERVSKMRNGLALAEARDYMCTGCRMKIRPQVYNDIRRGETIFTCENCWRILYYKVEVTA